MLSVTVLAACGSITGIKDVPEYLDSDFEHVGPREFITNVDLARIKLGMSPLQVKNRLGAPMLSGKDQDDRWDYVLKKARALLKSLCRMLCTSRIKRWFALRH